MSARSLKWVMFLLFTGSMIIVPGVLVQAGTLSPTDDTFVDEWSPNQNAIFGDEYYLIVRSLNLSGFELDSLLKFDFSSFPSGTTVNSARLNLYYYHWNNQDPTGRPLNTYLITEDWDEDTTNWTNRPGYNPTPSSTISMPASYGWVQWDVTSDVQDFIDGTTSNYGWQIMDSSASGNAMIYFYAKEYNADPNYRPYLEVDLECTGEWGYHLGDLNLDCFVNLIDFSLLANDWLLCSIPHDPDCTQAATGTFIGAGFAFDGNDTVGPATILYLYDDLNEGLLEPNDIILEYRNEPVNTGEELFNLIQAMPDVEPGQTFPIQIIRGPDNLQLEPVSGIQTATSLAIWQDCGNKKCQKIQTSTEGTCRCKDPYPMTCYYRMVIQGGGLRAVKDPSETDYSHGEVFNECYNQDALGNQYNYCIYADPYICIGK